MRPLLWALAWGLAVQAVADYATDWPWWALPLVGTPATVAALRMSRNNSLAWRWAYLCHRPPIDVPLVVDEDANLRASVLPGEDLCLIYDNRGPISGHVHSRTLLLGRPMMRAETVWREE